MNFIVNSLNEPAFPRALRECCTESFCIVRKLCLSPENYSHSQKQTRVPTENTFCLYLCKWCRSCKFEHPSESQINSQKFINSEDLFRSQILEDRYILKIHFQNQMRRFLYSFDKMTTDECCSSSVVSIHVTLVSFRCERNTFD